MAAATEGSPVQGAWRRSRARVAPRTRVRARRPARIARVTASLEWVGRGVTLALRPAGRSSSLLPLTTIRICRWFRVNLFAVGLRGQDLGKPAGAKLSRMPGDVRDILETLLPLGRARRDGEAYRRCKGEAKRRG